MVELVIRVVFSLAVILGLLWLVARTSSRRLGGAQRSAIKVVARQPLARSASVALVEVGERVLVVGVSEHGISLLTEMDPDELPEPEVVEPSAAAAGAVTAVRRARSALTRGSAQVDATPAVARTSPSADAALGGSVLSAQTWRQAWAAATTRNGSISD